MKKKAVVFIIGLMFSFLFSNPVETCVGRLLIIAISNSADQVIMGQMLATLINERTGTTVNIVQSNNVKQSHETVMGGEANIYINYIDTAWAGTGPSDKADDPQEIYTLVSQSYLEKFGMVWLKPFGFQGPLTSEASGQTEHASLAVPVTTKDVLKRFPVLDRVINKLAGRIDNDTIKELRKKSEKEPVEQVVREFLKSEKLI